MALSNWNLWVNRLLEQDGMTVAEHRLGLALARLLLGFKASERHVGRKLLRDTSRLDGRTFDRALAALADRGLIHVQPGARGRGNRGHYTLILTTQEKAAPQRPIKGVEKAAPQRPKAGPPKRPLSSTEKAAPQRPRRGLGREEHPAQSTGNEIRATAFETYRAAGGNLLLVRERNALAGAIGRAVKNGHDRELILDAVRDLGRNQEFPGLLTQRITDFKTNGRPCTWQGIGRLNLTIAQLTECGCQRCTERAHTLDTVALSARVPSRGKQGGRA